jgi:hypothetical protein
VIVQIPLSLLEDCYALLHRVPASETHAELWAEIPAFVAEIKCIFEPWQLAEHLETARQTERFDTGIGEDEDPEVVAMEREAGK